MKQLVLNADNPDLIITPMLNQYMLEHGEFIEPWALTRVFEELEKPGRNRSGSFSASAAGSCLRKQELGFIGAPEKSVLPGYQLSIFTLGTWTHRMLQAIMLSAKILEDIEIPLAWPKYQGKGSADGRGHVWWDHAKYQGREFIFEGKTVSARTWDKMTVEMKAEHRKQIIRYCLVSGIHLASYFMFDKGNISGGAGWYEMVFEPTKEELEESEAELIELNQAVADRELHDLLPGCKLKIGTDWTYCGFGKGSGLCPKVKSWEDAERKTLESKATANEAD